MLRNVCHLLGLTEHLNLLFLLLGKLHEVVENILFLLSLGALLDIFGEVAFPVVEVESILGAIAARVVIPDFIDVLGAADPWKVVLKGRL